MNDWIELDEDNRKREPKTGLFCIRCKRPIKETQAFESFISVEISTEGLPTMVRKSPIAGKHLIGSECWKKILKRAKS